MRRATYIRIVFVILAIFSLGLSCAATTQASSPSSSIGLKIAPLRSYPAQKPGETTSGSVKLTNLTGSLQTITLSSERFGVIDEDYNYQFEPSPTADWVQFTDKTIKLSSKKTKTINYRLAVPADAEPGGYYFTIIATTEGQSNSTNILEMKRVASLIYLEVSGTLIHETNLLSLDIPWLTMNGSATAAVRVANTGTIHDRARVGLTAQYWLGGKVVTSGQLEGLTLPHTIRRLANSLALPNIPGLYKFQATLAPPQGGVIKKTHYILYIPLWFILFLVILLGSVVGRFVIARRKKDTHNPVS